MTAAEIEAKRIPSPMFAAVVGGLPRREQVMIFGQLEMCEQLRAIMPGCAHRPGGAFNLTIENTVKLMKCLAPAARDKAIRKLFGVRSEALWIWQN